MRKLLVVVGCVWLVGALGVSSASAASRNNSQVYSFADGSVIPGSSSTLVTNSAGASFTLHTSGLPGGDAITIWMVVFNHPEHCTHGVLGLRCGEGDLADPAVDASVIYGAGHVVGNNGVGDFAGHRRTGVTTAADLFGPGISNPTGADVHLIVHDHGPATRALLPDALHGFGPCAPNPDCVDVQFAPHEQ